MKRITASKLVPVFQKLASDLTVRKPYVYASSSCYYLFMSLVPFVMLLCSLLKYTTLDVQLVTQYLEEYFQPSMAKVVGRIIANVYYSSGTTLTLSIILAMISASASMKAIMRGLDAAYGVQRKENYLIFSFKAIFYMLFVLAAIIVSLFIMVYGEKILDLVHGYLPNEQVLDWIHSKSAYGLVAVIHTIFFLCLYTIVPIGKKKFFYQLPGALFSAVMWVAFSALFSVYVSVSGKFGAYGVIGSIMVAMLWMYYCVYFLLIGGYLNDCFDKYLKKRKEAVSKENRICQN